MDNWGYSPHTNLTSSQTIGIINCIYIYICICITTTILRSIDKSDVVAVDACAPV